VPCTNKQIFWARLYRIKPAATYQISHTGQAPARAVCVWKMCACRGTSTLKVSAICAPFFCHSEPKLATLEFSRRQKHLPPTAVNQKHPGFGRFSPSPFFRTAFWFSKSLCGAENRGSDSLIRKRPTSTSRAVETPANRPAPGASMISGSADQR
jgi:hypothetical protein